MDRARLFRKAAERHNADRGPTGWRYPPDLRRLAVEHCEEQREAGRPYAEIAAELGITPASLSRWREEPPVAAAGPFRPVEILEPTSVGEPLAGLRVVTPRGLRIEGLALAQALELVRALG